MDVKLNRWWEEGCEGLTAVEISLYSVGQGWQAFSVKGQVVIILGIAGHVVSAATTHLCHCSIKAAKDTT